MRPQTVRALRRIAEELRVKRAGRVDAAALGDKASHRSLSAPPILSPGSRLLREWNGRMETVEVTRDGFLWHDRTFRTLSAVAVAITGTKWSGPKFFGLVGKRSGSLLPSRAARAPEAPSPGIR